ncbi:MAG TPA: hypothetical protein DD856_08385 [Sulfobacillus sp.]|nr:hypothetical protein [Sulfobacillus sp.]
MAFSLPYPFPQTDFAGCCEVQAVIVMMRKRDIRMAQASPAVGCDWGWVKGHRLLVSLFCLIFGYSMELAATITADRV